MTVGSSTLRTGSALDRVVALLGVERIPAVRASGFVTFTTRTVPRRGRRNRHTSGNDCVRHGATHVVSNHKGSESSIPLRTGSTSWLRQ